MSVILDALERAKREQARRKDTRVGGIAPIDIAPAPGTAAPESGTSPRQGAQAQGQGLVPLLMVFSFLLAMVLAVAAALIAYLVLERARPGPAPSPSLIPELGERTAMPPGDVLPGLAPTAMPGFVAANPPAVELPVAHQPATEQWEPAVGGAAAAAPAATLAPGLPAPAPMLPRLGSIICDERGCTAILDQRTVREGDWSGEFQVVMIRQEFVRLRDESGRTHTLNVRR